MACESLLGRPSSLQLKGEEPLSGIPAPEDWEAGTVFCQHDVSKPLGAIGLMTANFPQSLIV